VKALTICQPYAALICLPESHPEHKRVENRRWPTRYRGPLAIHAGKSRGWLDEDMGRPGYDYSGLRIADMTFGAVVGVADMIDCIHIDVIKRFAQCGLGMRTGLRWLTTHCHAEGPYCFVLENVRPLPVPVPYKGAQGFFDIPDALFATPTLLGGPR